MTKKIIRLIQNNADELVKLNQAIKDSFQEKEKNSIAKLKWEQACSLFHSSYDRLAFPGGLAEGMTQLKKGDAKTVEIAIYFIEADPYFFRSGYIKEEILRHLSHVDLTQKQIKQLQEILLTRIDGEDRREYQNFCRFAKKIADKDWIAKVNLKLESKNPDVVRRTKAMLKAI